MNEEEKMDDDRMLGLNGRLQIKNEKTFQHNDSAAAPVPSGHLEVCQKQTSTAKRWLIKQHVLTELSGCKLKWQDFTLRDFTDPFLQEHVDFIAVCDTEPCMLEVGELCTRSNLHVFQLNDGECEQEELEDEENLAASNNWLLPSSEFQGLWENLVYDENIKTNVLPELGKTSLCKALAQKLSIVLSDRYRYGQLIEINSHSLFSKWFSESGKLVMKMFRKIMEVVSDREALVCVLIDEVESLSASRQSMSGSDPSDAIRVVNSLLTQLDAIKRHPNVLILTTSNISGTIDVAFLDRADIKQYIGPPSAMGIYQIYYSCIQELIKACIIISNETLLDRRTIEMLFQHKLEGSIPGLSLQLQKISKASVGISGRTLRKLPLVAHAIYVQAPSVSLEKFLLALSSSVDRHFKESPNT